MSSINITMTQRGATYGDFRDNAAIADALMDVIQGDNTLWKSLDPVKRQALSVIMQKISRIISPGADPEYKDNWHNIQGYTKLAEDRCAVKVPCGLMGIGQVVQHEV